MKLDPNDSIDNRLLLSMNIEKHALKTAALEIKSKYFVALSNLINEIDSSDIVKVRLEEYKIMLFLNSRYDNKNFTFKELVTSKEDKNYLFLEKKYNSYLLMDMAIILQNNLKFQKSVYLLNSYLNKNQQKDIFQIMEYILYRQPIIDNKFISHNLLSQYDLNCKHLEKKQIRIIVTSNISSGKSTFINSVVGKNICKATQEICTENNQLIINKSFEDEKVFIINNKVISTYKNEKDLFLLFENRVKIIATAFNNSIANQYICTLIDTPGVNTKFKNHRVLAKEVLKKNNYEKIVYILNATKLGTDEEMSYLEWISENTDHEKLVFILNKIDIFRVGEDDIQQSVNGIKNDLDNIGITNPIIIPYSSYFAYLVKLKESGMYLSEDEEDEYKLLLKKFSKKEYNLSKYCEGVDFNDKDHEKPEIKKCLNILEMEKHLFGGKLH